jgi:2-keto-4-pentenoate hydratase/2-oxohepta-3-ene-1,7-dioic acid hydratase in catechol pathway
MGPHDDVAISPGSLQFDYELEVCAVIGRSGFNIPRDEAESHIAGYMMLCDWSARDLQLEKMAMGLGPAKGKDGQRPLVRSSSPLTNSNPSEAQRDST